MTHGRVHALLKTLLTSAFNQNRDEKKGAEKSTCQVHYPVANLSAKGSEIVCDFGLAQTKVGNSKNVVRPLVIREWCFKLCESISS